MNTEKFVTMTEDELKNTDGGGLVFEVIGCVIAVGTAIYGLGYAYGQRAGYDDKYYRNGRRR